MKKVISVLLLIAMLFTMAACGGNEGTKEDELKVGFIFLHDENSTYDKNFMDAAKAACEAMGVTYLQKANIPETNECYEAAIELVEEGCGIIFADSFGHEAHILKAAKENPEVQFCHATGTTAHTEEVANFHNAFASIYEGRYLAGVTAGLKLNEMIEAGKITADKAKMGYVGAFTYAEVISGYTSFYLGAKSVCPSVTMDVQFTGSWYDEQLEKEAANALINKGCVLISQHADSMGAPTACENAGIPNVSYNGSTAAACPETFLISSRINWEPYYKYIIECVQNDKAIDVDWTGTLETGSVELSDLGKNVAAGTADKLAEIEKGLKDGTVKVFDTAAFTVSGDAITANVKVDAEGHVTSYMADVDTDAAYTGDTEAIKDGAFAESSDRSAPYFDLAIDGITRLNSKF
ncbi:MAG: BMP family ABC transporter substrate-binding protein [Clostridia bacterium]|nr:BMP family ABC transporter substrate-binding protein [Clostridia bacterium]